MPGAVLGKLAGRAIRREDSGPSWARTLTWISAGVLAGASVAVVVGVRTPLVLAPAWLAVFGIALGRLATRLRAGLVIAVFGLALGVASLFVVLGVASGAERLLVASLARLNGHALVSKYGLDFFEYEAVADRLAGDPRIRAASPFVFGVGALVRLDAQGPAEEPAEGPAEELGADRALPAAGGEQAPVVVTVKGVDPQRLAGFRGAAELFRRGTLADLRPAGPREPPGIALGWRLARRVDAEIGDRVRVVVPASIRAEPGPFDAPRHAEFEVLAVLDTGFVEFDTSFALVHLTAAQALMFGEMRATGIELELEEPRLGTALPIARELADELDAPRLDKGYPPHFRAASWVDRSPMLVSLRQSKVVIILVLGLIVVVASGSLIGALLLLVRRKRCEIGALAAMGATRAQLFWVFELVGVYVGLLGSLVGLALGAASLAVLALLRFDLDAEIYMLDHLPVAFTFTDMIIPSALAVLVCALASGPVAWRVARARPLDLLLERAAVLNPARRPRRSRQP